MYVSVACLIFLYRISSTMSDGILRNGVPTTLLARIRNEPPLGGGGCSNVCSNEDLDAREVTFVLSRDVLFHFTTRTDFASKCHDLLQRGQWKRKSEEFE